MSVAHLAHVPAVIWRTPPLSKADVASVCAELKTRLRSHQLRPKVAAVIATRAATVYLSDYGPSAMLVPWLLGLGAEQVLEVDTSGLLWISGLAYVERWATAPDRPLLARPVAVYTPPVAPAVPVCRDCKHPITEPAPTSASLCRPCWRARVAAGRQKQIALDLKLLEAAAAA